MPNPYAILVALMLILAALVTGEVHGDRAGSTRVQVAWDHANTVAGEVRAKRIADGTAATKKLQEKKDEEHAKELAVRDDRERRLRADVASLRARPARPGPITGGGNPVAPPPGTPALCTGAGLFRDDAEFLVRFADTAQQVRNQRDEYGRLYEAAREELERVRNR
jgi:hypothetical protein